MPSQVHFLSMACLAVFTELRDQGSTGHGPSLHQLQDLCRALWFSLGSWSGYTQCPVYVSLIAGAIGAVIADSLLVPGVCSCLAWAAYSLPCRVFENGHFRVVP